MDWVRHGVVVVALAACGPSVGGGDEHGDPSASEDSGGDPSSSASASGSGSASTSNGSASTSGTGESSSASASTGESSSADTIETATVTFTEDGPYPPEGGEIGESGDCSCCGSSLHVVLEGGTTDVSMTLSSASFAAFTVTCPAATVVGLDDAQITCGNGEFTVATDGFVDGFDEETWTATFGGSPFSVDAQSDCVYGGACDCNCVPTDCELFLSPEVDDG